MKQVTGRRRHEWRTWAPPGPVRVRYTAANPGAARFTCGRYRGLTLREVDDLGDCSYLRWAVTKDGRQWHGRITTTLRAYLKNREGVN